MHAELLTLDFAGEVQKKKNKQGELKNNIPKNCARNLYERQRMHHQSLYTF